MLMILIVILIAVMMFINYQIIHFREWRDKICPEKVLA